MNLPLFEPDPATRWIWAPETHANQYIAATHVTDIKDKVASASITLFCDTKYKLYVNGRFVNAGPCHFRKPFVYVDTYDITAFLLPGKNRIAVLAHYIGVTVKYNTAEEPGLLAEYALTDEAGHTRRIGTGTDWSITPLTCWQADTPRRNWAIEHIEEVRLDDPSFIALARFASDDYETGLTVSNVPEPQSPRVFDRPDLELRLRPVPPLQWRREDLTRPVRIFRGNTEIYNRQDNAVRINHEHVWPEYDETCYEMCKAGTVYFERRTGEPGVLLSYDFGRMCAGDPSVELWCEHPCTLDVAMAETVDAAGRPNVWRLGSLHYTRYHLPAGLSRARFYHFNNYRYLYLSLKDAVGRVEVHRVSSHHTRAALAYAPSIHCNDRAVESLYRISRRAIMLNTQAGGYDCNSREQGMYWGDNIWAAESVGHLTGDFSHMKHLCYSATDEVNRHGPFIPGSLFGAGQPLYDYCLVPPALLARYHRFTGDVQTVADNLPAMHRIVEAFRALKGADGLLEWKRIPEELGGLLFLDHPGVGWHGSTTVGIEREDISIGFNLFYLQALQAMVSCEAALGQSNATLTAEINTLMSALRQHGWHAERGMFIDSTATAGTAPRFSQLVNALAITTGLFETSALARHALARIMDTRRFPWVAQGTPYSLFFVAEAAAAGRAGADAVAAFTRDYAGMLARGATTTWEGWQGENQDSYCHAWSAALPHLLRRAVAGLAPLEPGYGRLELRPDFRAFEWMDLTCHIPQGPVRIAWRQTGPNLYNLDVHLPPTVTGECHVGDEPVHGLRDHTTLTLSGPT